MRHVLGCWLGSVVMDLHLRPAPPSVCRTDNYSGNPALATQTFQLPRTRQPHGPLLVSMQPSLITDTFRSTIKVGEDK